MIKTAAVIAFSKMAALTASRALVSGSGGVVEVSATTAAELAFVNGVTSAIQTQLNSITTVNADTLEPHGIIGTPTITYLGSRVIRIAHPYSYYYRGVKVTSTVNKDVTVTNTSGSYYVCFTDAAHTAAASTSIDYPTQVPFAGFFWNATTGDYIFEKEAHIAGTGSAVMHEYLHDTRGAAYDSGGAISGYVLSSDLLVDIQIALDSLTFWDEDIELIKAARLEGANWDKWYRGAAGAWLKDAADTIPAFYAANVPKINTFSTPNWSLTSVTNTNFFNTYIFATNSAEVTNGFIIIPGQNQATTLAGAQALSITNLALGTIPSQEWLPMYQLVWQYKTTNTNNNARVTLEAVTDLRSTISPGVSVGVTTLHNSLGGRSDADSHPASAITGTAATLAGSEALTTKTYNGLSVTTGTDTFTLTRGTASQQHIGAFAAIFNFSASTNINFPTTGTLATLAGVEVLTLKDIDGGTASNTTRITLPKAATATLAALTRKEATIVFDSTLKKAYIDNGSNLKVIGGGLLTEVKTSSFNAEAGKHYLVIMSSADITATLPSGAAESVIAFTIRGNATTAYNLILAGAGGTETVTYWDVPYTSATFLPRCGWLQVSWATTGTTWMVDDQATFVSGTFAGACEFTGLITANLGIKPAATKGVDFSANAAISGTGITSTSQLFAQYEYGVLATTFSGANFTTSGSYNIRWTKVGRKVTLEIPAIAANVSGGAPTTIASTTALPAALIPGVAITSLVRVAQAGTTQNQPGMAIVDTSGVINVYKDLVGTAGWSTSMGMSAHSITYSV